MKYTCFSFLLFIAAAVQAQNPFEGKIVYKVTSTDKPTDGELTIFFGKPGIRLEIKENNRPDKEPESLIINLDSGKVFTLMPKEKKYKTSNLRKQMPRKVSGGKTIAGFSTQAVNLEFSGMPHDFSKIFGPSILYTTGDLVYPIPAEYKANPEFMMISNGKIVLGGEFMSPEDDDRGTQRDSVQKSEFLFTVMASQVVPQKLDAALFVAPTGFENWSYDYGIDSAMLDTDTTIITPVQPPVKNKKKQPKKKSTTTKESASRRKND